ncbi:FAD/NAD(P)-binding domain-containing protein [Cadophora sp. DSE1049]|nr:FAD/NAD(P)-binding domain-containing protein [Cadophora sp. DSE1049]
MAPITSSLKLEVLIVGCGIAGLSAAVACSQKGFNVRVLEASAQFAHATGLLVSPNASRVLCDMGLREGLEKVAIHMKRVLFLKYDDGTVLSEQHYDDAEESLGAPLWQLHRADLHDALLGKARQLGVEITMGAKVKSFDWQAPSVLLEDGEAVMADVVLAADGYRSRARVEMLEGYEDLRFSGNSAYRTLIHRSAFKDEPKLESLLDIKTQTSRVWVGEGCHILVYPIRQGEYLNVVATQPANHTKGPKFVVPIGPQEFLDRYKHWDLTLVRILERLPKDNLLEWKLCDLEPMETWLFPGEKITLLGDASHAMLPSSAQGAGMGIEDGCAIAELLARAQSRDQIPQVLKAFEKLRLPRCTEIMDSGRQNAKKWHKENAKGGTVTDSMWEYDVKSAAQSIPLEVV